MMASSAAGPSIAFLPRVLAALVAIAATALAAAPAPGTTAPVAAAAGAAGADPATTAAPRNVLVLYSHGRLLSGNVDTDRGLSAGFAARPDVPVALSFEVLDSARFRGPEFDRVVVTYLRDKYALHPPEVVIVANDQALDVVAQYRAVLFPNVPVVYMGVSSAHLRSIPPLPRDFVGTPIAHDFLGTVEQARRWHPRARQLYVVTGTTSWDMEWAARLRLEAARLAPGLDVEFLSGLPVDDLRRRLRELPVDSIVYTPGFFRAGDGQRFEPREAVRLIAEASTAPVYGAFASCVGTGAVGGRVVNYETVGRIAADTALAVLAGGEPATLQPPAVVPTPLQVDWRQLQRWRIADGAVPADAVVQFEQPSLWEAHRTQVLLGAVVMLLQAGLIVALLFERRRRHQTVSALARSEEHMRLAAKAAGLSTWVMHDEAGAEAAEGKRARPSDGLERTNTPVVDFHETLARIAPQDVATVTASLHEARETSRDFEVEYRVRAPDGTWRWQSARGRADHTQPRRLLGVAIDVTQRKHAELQAEQDRAALHHMTRVSLLGQLSASIAHQLNQPLASILANAEAAQKMLQREPVDVAELREICADIVTQDHHAAQVIRRLSALFRRGQPLFEPLDLNELVRDTIELTGGMLRMRHVTVATQLASALPSVSGDRVQLQQLLLNLVVNACDAVECLPDTSRVVTIRTSSDGGTAQLCVADRGPGVPPEAMDKVFEAFWSTKPRGMGMGLAVCRSIAEAHHGSLTVRNVAAGGAEFCAQLPASPAA
jgi:C4-dicarboxylate-specific signal transduction histidine kinase